MVRSLKPRCLKLHTQLLMADLFSFKSFQKIAVEFMDELRDNRQDLCYSCMVQGHSSSHWWQKSPLRVKLWLCGLCGYVSGCCCSTWCDLIIRSGELIVSRYVAESITMIAGRFGHVGLCQLRTKPVLYAVDKGLRGRNVLQSLLLILLRICSRSVCPILTSSNEPLQHH